MLRPPFYIISDTHFGHRNILKYADRPFDHEAMMVRRWKRIIGENDAVLHLGDLFFSGDGGYTNFVEIAEQLPGCKFLILGNHDKRKYDYFEEFGFKVIKPFTMTYRGYKVSFDHYPKILPPLDRKIHIHGHIHDHGYAYGQPTRHGNINVSVEVLDYRPQRITRLLNKEISRRNQKRRYLNSKHRRIKAWR